MKGTHSTGKGGRGKVVAIVVCVVVLVLVGIVVFLLASGRGANSPDVSASSTASASASSSTASQRATLPDPGVTEAIETLDPHASVAADNGSQDTYVNARFGFSLAVPEGFVIGSEIEGGSGVILTSNALRMTVTVVGYDNDQGLDLDAVTASLWNGSDDSIVRKDNGRVVIYQYDDEYEYFIWAYVGAGSIDQMTIRYPLQDDNRDELAAAQALMQGFLPGDLSIPH